MVRRALIKWMEQPLQATLLQSIGVYEHLAENRRSHTQQCSCPWQQKHGWLMAVRNTRLTAVAGKAEDCWRYGSELPQLHGFLAGQ